MLRGIFLTLFLSVMPAAAAELCLAPSTHPAGLGENVSVDCTTTPAAWANDWIGYSTDGVCNSGVTTCAETHDFLWTVSASATDPFVNSGPAVDRLYLWFVCTTQPGLAAGAFDLAGDLVVSGCIPGDGVLFVSSGQQLLFAVGGCPAGPMVVAQLIVTPSTVSVEESSWGGIKAFYR
jgi:hypothetical protein